MSARNAHEAIRDALDPLNRVVSCISATDLYHVHAGDGREIVAFHWHPGHRHVPLPHAQFRTLTDPIPMGKVHCPSGRVALEAVVRLVIGELGVEPIRPDWEQVPSQPERTVVERRSRHAKGARWGASQNRSGLRDRRRCYLLDGTMLTHRVRCRPPGPGRR